jgi:uncharacterized protein (UPF0218 family)/phosphopantetheine adenylyltransferase
MNYKFQLSALGGTFDHLHIGHKRLLDTAFKYSLRVIIGVATEQLTTGKAMPASMESFKQRSIGLKDYLESKGYLSRVDIVELSDIYGPTITDENIQAIFATEDKLENIKKINLKRVENGFGELEQVLVPLVFSTDSLPVSSSRIRNGETDREGNIYFDLLSEKKRFNLPEELRSSLKKPLGKVIKKFRPNNLTMQQFNNSFTIAVGDIAAINLYKLGIAAHINIVDYKTKRHDITDQEKKTLSEIQKLSDVTTTDNQAGTIERRAAGVIRRSIGSYLLTSKMQVILVNGEEDLMTIPAILISPLDSLVLYGHPEKGIVIVKVTESKKKEVLSIFNKMR